MTDDTWFMSARRTIESVHAGIPSDATLEERTKLIDDAYPFGERANFPYKAWLRARRGYLVRYGYVPRNAPGIPLLSPLDKAKINSELIHGKS